MENQIFDYGDYKLDRQSLLSNINTNIDGYIKYKNYSKEKADQFINAVNYIAAGIKKGTISKDLEFVPSKPGQFKFIDTEGGIIEDNEIHDDVLRFINTIAIAQGKNPSNEALLKKRQKEKEEKEKVVYGDFEDFFVKSINPKATGITDPNLDLESWREANKGKEGEAVSNIVREFIKKGNPDPETLEALNSVAEGLLDNDINAQDKVNMNRATWRAPFYNYIFKGIKGAVPPVPPVDKKEGKEGKEGVDGNQEKLDGQVVVNGETPKVTSPQLLNRVANAAMAVNQGDYYIEGSDKNRIQWVLWNGNFEKVPMSFINNANLEALRKLLQEKLKNRYETEKVEDLLTNVINDINNHGISSNAAANDYDSDNIRKLRNLLHVIGISNSSALVRGVPANWKNESIIRNLSTLPDPAWKRMRGFRMGPVGYGSFKQGGVIKAEGGTALTYNPNNELYKSLYKEGATSVGLAGANNSLRSKDLKFNTTYKDELDLNTYYKQYNLYSNPEDRHKDFITWANKHYVDTDDIGSLLNRYNDSIDNMYKYKQTNNATTYRSNGNVLESLETGNFNTTYNDHYALANANVFGYDPNSIKIAGSATMGRHPDITESDIAMDFSKHEITNEGLKKLLTENKLVKTKTGHYTIAAADEVPVDQEGDQKDDQKDKSSSSTVDQDDFVMPKKETPVTVPQEPSELYRKLPAILGNFWDTINTNNHNQELNEQRPLALQNPIFGHRRVYGNLRAIAEANRRGAQRTALTKQLFTSDNAQNMAMLYDTFNMNTNDFIQALHVDDATMRETAEKSWLLDRENYLYNQNVYWGNTQRSVAHEDNTVYQGRIARNEANRQSRVNMRNDISDLVNDYIDKQSATKRGVKSKELMTHIEQNPITYIDAWGKEHQKLWDRYKAGDNITDPIEKQTIAHIQTQMQQAYLQGLYPNDVLATKPSMKTLRFGTPYQPIVEVAEKPVNTGKRGMKLIPYMRKKFN